MKKKIITSLLVTILFCSGLRAQQDPMYSQYMSNSLAINPAFTGCRYSINATVMRRMQWLGVSGAPTTTTLVLDAPIKSKQFGVGLVLVNEQIGITSTTGVTLNYGYSIKVSEKNGTLSFGLNGSIVNLQMNLADVKTSIPDPEFGANFSTWQPNVGVGVLYNTSKFYVGFSIPHIINNKLNKGGSTLEALTGKQLRHLYLLSGYAFNLSDKLDLTTSTLIKYVTGSSIELDLNANMWFYSKVSIGFGYRTSSEIIGQAQFRIGELVGIGYSYDYQLKSIQRYTSGTHEIMLRVQFSKPKNNFRKNQSSSTKNSNHVRSKKLSYLNNLF